MYIDVYIHTFRPEKVQGYAVDEKVAERPVIACRRRWYHQMGWINMYIYNNNHAPVAEHAREERVGPPLLQEAHGGDGEVVDHEAGPLARVGRPGPCPKHLIG